MKILVCSLFLFCFALSICAQETVPIPVEDLRQFRKAAADRDFYRAAYEEDEAQKAAALKSAADWKKLYLDEKDRADRVQGGRITENQGAIADLQTANRELHAQADRDRQKIGELTAENISLRSSRKWYLATGFVGGAVTGWLLKGQSANFTNPFTSRPAAEMILKPAGVTDFNNKIR